MLPHTHFVACCHTHSLQHVATHTVTVLGGTWHLHYPTENEIRQNPVLKFSSNLTVNTFPVCCNLTASGALRDKTALRLYQGVLYLQNVLWFHGTLVSVISCTLKGEVWPPVSWSLRNLLSCIWCRYPAPSCTHIGQYRQKFANSPSVFSQSNFVEICCKGSN